MQGWTDRNVAGSYNLPHCTVTVSEDSRKLILLSNHVVSWSGQSSFVRGSGMCMGRVGKSRTDITHNRLSQSHVVLASKGSEYDLRPLSDHIGLCPRTRGKRVLSKRLEEGITCTVASPAPFLNLVPSLVCLPKSLISSFFDLDSILTLHHIHLNSSRL
jgi:hypothetical protein